MAGNSRRGNAKITPDNPLGLPVRHNKKVPRILVKLPLPEMPTSTDCKGCRWGAEGGAPGCRVFGIPRQPKGNSWRRLDLCRTSECLPDSQGAHTGSSGPAEPPEESRK